ncbi:MAG: AraC family transcriptional regulator [Verrucomicrobiota bacterium]
MAKPGDSFDWHNHPFHEFTLVTDSDTTIGYPPGKMAVRENTLLMYRRGEQHGAWCSGRQTPRFWVVHFTIGGELRHEMDRFRAADPKDRVWQLSEAQVESFRWQFLQILTEHTQGRSRSLIAASAWLQLLLVTVQRWAEGESAARTLPAGISPDLLRLWHLINASVGKPDEFVKQVYLIPNYDSLRHAFKKAFGCSPREMMRRLRLQQAKNMLLETSLSMKEISSRLGYERQHEFTRTFHQEAGVAPSEWRANPFQSSLIT